MYLSISFCCRNWFHRSFVHAILIIDVVVVVVMMIIRTGVGSSCIVQRVEQCIPPVFIASITDVDIARQTLILQTFTLR